MKLSSLKLNPKNPRLIKDAKFKKLCDSIRDFPKMMELRPIVIDADGMILGGNMRFRALKELGFKDVPDEWVKAADSLTEEEKKRFIIEDNVPFGEWDYDILAADFEISELVAWGMEPEELGINLGPEEPVDAEPQIDKAEELNKVWKCKTGDLWSIGDHRLLCGDSTKREDVERVMQGEKTDMIFTDPPYNVASESRNYAADKSKAMKKLSESKWDQDFDIATIFPNLEFVMGKDCAVYICTSHWLVQKIWEWMWSWSDFCFYCVWCKPNPMPSLSKRHWTWATELIPYAVRGKHIANFPKEGHALNWWSFPKSKETEHPTEKVIEVPTNAVEFSSTEGDSVFDPFLGSGTTMVACENLKRKCRGIEISPGYCAVILERMKTAFPGIAIKRER